MTMAATGAMDVPPPKSAPGINAAVAAKSPTPSASSSVGSSGGDYVSKTIAAADDTLELIQEEGKLGFVFPMLKEIPARVFAIRGLRVLKLAGNELGTLPAQLCGMRDLAELDVSRCKLTELPDGISQLSSLRELCASENDLTALPASIGRLRHLTKLLLFKNKLTTLPEELASCTALSEVRACHCLMHVHSAGTGEAMALLRLARPSDYPVLRSG
jgi:Leucine-rich repeat (LRR) protein